MAAVAGILGQEILGVQPVWYEAGTKEYIFPATTLTAIEFLTLGALELKRYRGWKEHKTVSPGLPTFTLSITFCQRGGSSWSPSQWPQYRLRFGVSDKFKSTILLKGLATLSQGESIKWNLRNKKEKHSNQSKSKLFAWNILSSMRLLILNNTQYWELHSASTNGCFLYRAFKLTNFFLCSLASSTISHSTPWSWTQSKTRLRRSRMEDLPWWEPSLSPCIPVSNFGFEYVPSLRNEQLRNRALNQCWIWSAFDIVLIPWRSGCKCRWSQIW